jgi:hypothetical protein
VITTLVRRALPLVGLGVLLGLIVQTQHAPQASADAWFHLRFGHEFLTNWTVRDPGHLGMYDTAEWLPTQWLPQMGMAWTQEQFGIAGLVWITGVLVMLLAVTIFVSCRGHAAQLPAATATGLALMAASPGLSARPQLLSYLFVTLTAAAWFATARDGRPRYWTIGLAWAWPMLHGMWPIGISISVVALAGIALQRDQSRRTMTRLAAIPVLSCLVTLLNPLGPSVVLSLFDVGGRSEYFAEWGPTDFTAPAAAVLAIMFAIVFVAGMRSPSIPWIHALLSLLALAWALYSMRTTPVAALILAPVLAAQLQTLVPDGQRISAREGVSLAVMFAASCLVLVAVASHRASEQVVPAWVDQRLDALPDNTRVLNDWGTGSYMLFRHPQLDLVMHGYGDVFTDEELARNAALSRLEPGWDERVADLDVTVALVDPDSPLGYALESQSGWQRVEGDEHFALLTPPEN